MKIGIIIAIIVVLLVGYFISTNNTLVRLNNTVKEAFSTMDVYLKKRWDLIPNLVETVKGYAKHEESTLKEIVELRNSSYDSLSSKDKVDVNNKLTSGINKLMAIAEAYPELKASENFKELNKELSSIENDIANARKYYNGAVKQFNNKVMMFPSSIVASILGYKQQEMFAASESERENVKVEF